MRVSVLIFLYAFSSSAAEYKSCFLRSARNIANTFSTRTGNREVDRANELEMKVLSARFGAYPDFFVYDDAGSPNAFATPEKNGDSDDGTLAFGINLLQSQILKSSGGVSSFAVPAIMAHEFGHIIQFKNGTRLIGKQQELQADYLAGWYMGKRNGFSELAPTVLRTIAFNFYSLGDYSFFSPDHHGTPQERAAAVVAGFANASSGLVQAYAASLLFVSASTSRNTSDITLSSDDLSKALAKLLRAKEDGFSAFRRSPDSLDPQFWSAAIGIPGATKCGLYFQNKDDFNSGIYDCVVFQTLDEVLAKDQYIKWTERIEESLGSNWKLSVVETNGRAVRFKAVEFTRATQEIDLTLERSSSRTGFKVVVGIRFSTER